MSLLCDRKVGANYTAMYSRPIEGLFGFHSIFHRVIVHKSKASRAKCPFVYNELTFFKFSKFAKFFPQIILLSLRAQTKNSQAFARGWRRTIISSCWWTSRSSWTSGAASTWASLRIRGSASPLSWTWRAASSWRRRTRTLGFVFCAIS